VRLVGFTIEIGVKSVQEEINNKKHPLLRLRVIHSWME
jgi:hypothetical protein